MNQDLQLSENGSGSEEHIPWSSSDSSVRCAEEKSI